VTVQAETDQKWRSMTAAEGQCSAATGLHEAPRAFRRGLVRQQV